MVPCKEELSWNNDYMQGEFEADDVMNQEIVYKIHETPYVETLNGRKREPGYITYLNNARVAKAAIGPATNDGWVFAMIMELALHVSKTSKGKYERKGAIERIPVINEEDFKTLTFTYIRGLQDFVITGVKHNSNGSKGFELLYLRNFCKQENGKDIQKILSDNLELDHLQISKMFKIIYWASSTGILDACKAFLRIYNKGVFPRDPDILAYLEEHESFIQRNTHFGRLVQPVYDVIDQIKTNRKEAFQKSQELSVNFEDEMKKILGI